MLGVNLAGFVQRYAKGELMGTARYRPTFTPTPFFTTHATFTTHPTFALAHEAAEQDAHALLRGVGARLGVATDRVGWMGHSFGESVAV